MRRYNLTFTTSSAGHQQHRQTSRYTEAGISEVRWLGKGEHPTQGGERLLFSGNESGKHESGVGFLLSKHAKKSLISWTPINERVITARFYTRFRKVTFIQCYAPTNNASKEDKDEFYDILEKTIKDVNSGDIKILMGDLNAKVGAQNENLEEIMGKNGVGQINENGTYFTQFCSNANLVIGGTLFPHKQIHKTTWVSPDKKTHNQIDHITISRKWRSSLLDVRNKRGADVASDHHLIVGTLRIKLAVPKQPADMKRIKLNIEKLRIPQIAKSFKEKCKRQ
ncbi:craniofacial development protein 2-like [Atheta coriaria]|uniref:craniofacial development protein 2-like n=1 Tax=Dalotia coriaria TaxID=877792 RepID=UPI0031F45FFF